MAKHALCRSCQMNIREWKTENGKAGGNVRMWYVMQAVSGQENRTVRLLERMISSENLEQCFIPMRRLRKKFRGTWNEVTEKLFPGYVFLVTERPQFLYEELREVPALTKILGKCGEYFTPLPEGETELLLKMQKSQKDQNCREKGITMEISQIAMEEERRIRVISGPLQNMEGQIKRLNLHKRIAEVEMEFMGGMRTVYMGIEIMEDISPN